MKVNLFFIIPLLTTFALELSTFAAPPEAGAESAPLRLNTDVIAHFSRALNASVYRRTFHCPPVNGRFKTLTSGIAVVDQDRIRLEQNETHLWIKTSAGKEYSVSTVESTSSDGDMLDIVVQTNTGQIIANYGAVYVSRLDVIAGLEAVLGIHLHEVTDPYLEVRCNQP